MMSDDDQVSQRMAADTGPFSAEEIAAERIASDRDVVRGEQGLQEINIDPLPRENMIIEGAEEGGTVDVRRRNTILAIAATVILCIIAVVVGISVPVAKRNADPNPYAGKTPLSGQDILLDQQGLENEQNGDLDLSDGSTEGDVEMEVNPSEVAAAVARQAAILRVLKGVSGNVVTTPTTPQYEAANWLIIEDDMQLEASSGRLVQRYVAALLYFSLDGESWPNRTDYLSSKSECQWQCVTCNIGSLHVRKLDMHNNALSGVIPEEIGQLQYLGECCTIFKIKPATLQYFQNSLLKFSAILS